MMSPSLVQLLAKVPFRALKSTHNFVRAPNIYVTLFILLLAILAPLYIIAHTLILHLITLHSQTPTCTGVSTQSTM